jgi:hypothetical protein
VQFYNNKRYQYYINHLSYIRWKQTMQRTTLIVAIDLGTNATTASHVIVHDSFTAEGGLYRDRGEVSVTNVRDWPGGSNGAAIGNVCVPTELIYRKADRKLLLWGFYATQHLHDPLSDIEPETVYLVEHIKLLLQTHEDATIISSSTARRYRELRNTLIATLDKQPEEVFEDFLNEIVRHVIKSANRKYFNGISSFNIELLLAFPSGWPDYLRTKVAEIGARAMTNAIAANGLKNVVFGVENVYTVPETLCGAKEWLRDTLAETRALVDMGFQRTNLDEINVRQQCFRSVQCLSVYR